MPATEDAPARTVSILCDSGSYGSKEQYMGTLTTSKIFFKTDVSIARARYR